MSYNDEHSEQDPAKGSRGVIEKDLEKKAQQSGVPARSLQDRGSEEPSPGSEAAEPSPGF